MMTSARPMAMSRSRVQTRISLRKECAVLDPEGEVLKAGDTGSGLSGIAEVGGSFSSALSIFGCQVFIARALRAALDLIAGGAAWGAPAGFAVGSWIRSRDGVLPAIHFSGVGWVEVLRASSPFAHSAQGKSDALMTTEFQRITFWRGWRRKSGGPPAAGRQDRRSPKRAPCRRLSRADHSPNAKFREARAAITAVSVRRMSLPREASR